MLSVFIFIVCLGFIQTLSVGIDKKGVCLQIHGKLNQLLTVTYVVSGLTEEQTKMKLFDDFEKVAKELDGKENSFDYILPKAGTYQVCFYSTDKNVKQVSFDFDLEGIDKNYASQESMEDIVKKLQKQQKELAKVYRNQHFQADRESEHALILETAHNFLRFCAISKIVVVIIICFAQLIAVKHFFKYNLSDLHNV